MGRPRRETCALGHRLDAGNVVMRGKNRECRTCREMRQRQRGAKVPGFWRKFSRCDECGADERRACRSADDQTAVVSPCSNRAVIKVTATHCRRGHEFDPANTVIRPDGRRICKACDAIRQRNARERRRLRRVDMRADR